MKHPTIACHISDPIGQKLAKGDLDGANRLVREAERAGGEKSPKVESPLEALFAELWREKGNGWEPEREYEFAKSIGRKWRFDFCWRWLAGQRIHQIKVAVEIEGFIRQGGRHQRTAGATNDLHKYNAAQILGWRVLRFSGRDLKDRPDECIAQVRQLLEGP